jgi:hypothetical protein
MSRSTTSGTARAGGANTILFCFWPAWSRFRVVPLLDRTAPSVFAAVDVALREVGGVPTYLLAGQREDGDGGARGGDPGAEPVTVAFARHYGLTVATCVPADPASKGGSEACVRVAKADLAPTEANLLPAYGSVAELEAACVRFTEAVSRRPHRVTRRAPAEMLLEELHRPHPLPERPFTAAFGTTRVVGTDTPMVVFEGGRYAVPHTLAGATVWVRRHGERVVIVHVGECGTVEVARHRVTALGSPRVDDGHFPPPPPGARAG